MLGRDKLELIIVVRAYMPYDTLNLVAATLLGLNFPTEMNDGMQPS